jgi:hypothetical protein
MGLADSPSRLDGRLADRSRLGGAGLVVVAAAFVLLAGAPGVAAAAAVVVCWVVFPATYAFALGNVALAALVGESAVLEIALVEVALVGLLVAPAGRLGRPARPVAIAVVAVAAGGALAWATSRGAIGLPLAALAVVAGTALGGYGLHRYQLVDLDRVGDGRE